MDNKDQVMDIIEKADSEEMDISEYKNMATLTSLQRMLILEVVDNMFREQPLTDSEICEKVGCNYSYLSLLRNKNEKFQAALGSVIYEALKSKRDAIIGNVIRAGKIPKHWQANKFLMEIIGEYVPRSAHLNINANVRNAPPSSPEQAVDTLLVKLGELGYSPEQVAQRMRELKMEGAF